MVKIVLTMWKNDLNFLVMAHIMYTYNGFTHVHIISFFFSFKGFEQVLYSLLRLILLSLIFSFWEKK